MHLVSRYFCSKMGINPPSDWLEVCISLRSTLNISLVMFEISQEEDSDGRIEKENYLL